MNEATYTLTLRQLVEVVKKANNLGQTYVLDAVTDAGYAADKKKRIHDHICHSAAAMNDIIQDALLNTPEIRNQLQSLRPITE